MSAYPVDSSELDARSVKTTDDAVCDGDGDGVGVHATTGSSSGGHAVSLFCGATFEKQLAWKDATPNLHTTVDGIEPVSMLDEIEKFLVVKEEGTSIKSGS